MVVLGLGSGVLGFLPKTNKIKLTGRRQTSMPTKHTSSQTKIFILKNDICTSIRNNVT